MGVKLDLRARAGSAPESNASKFPFSRSAVPDGFHYCPLAETDSLRPGQELQLRVPAVQCDGPKRVEAGQARPEHDQSSFDHGGGGTPRLESAISQGRQQRRGEAEDLFAVADQAAENG
jgi:hypothetical protein